MHLTARQREALQLLRGGLTYRQAGKKMGMASSGAISSTLGRAAEVNGFKSITDLLQATRYMPLDKPPTVKRTRKRRGVYRMHTGKWKAAISVKGRSVHIGCYCTPDEAFAARLEAEKKYRGTNS